MTYLLLSSHANSWWPCWPDAKRGYEGGVITTTMELISVLSGAENSAMTAFAVLLGWRHHAPKWTSKSARLIYGSARRINSGWRYLFDSLFRASVPWSPGDGYPTPPPCHLSGSIPACCKSREDPHGEERQKHGKVLFGMRGWSSGLSREWSGRREREEGPTTTPWTSNGFKKVIPEFCRNAVWAALGWLIRRRAFIFSAFWRGFSL